MVTLPQHPEANQTLGEIAVELNVRGVNAALYMPAQHRAGHETLNHYPLALAEEVIEVESPLAGMHQQSNIALAIASALELRNNHGYIIANTDIEEGIRSTEWPGRLELFPASKTSAQVLLDVAHNPAGAWA